MGKKHHFRIINNRFGLQINGSHFFGQMQGGKEKSAT
jgi:hypothetical protein